MSKLDAFSAQLVAIVRKMSDDALLALVRNQLGTAATVASSAARTAPAGVTRVAGATKKRAPIRKTTARSKTSVQQLVAAVEKTIQTSKGLGLSEIAAAVGRPKPQVSKAIVQLKAAKRIHQGGERRFARYARDAQTARAASLRARRMGS